jgi:hypothetical protein
MKYRFDYIKENVDKWNPSIPRDAETIKNTIPFYVLLPWIGLDDDGNMTVTPAKDYYGEVIPDLKEWHRQRDEYCEKLAKEYGYERD